MGPSPGNQVLESEEGNGDGGAGKACKCGLLACLGRGEEGRNRLAADCARCFVPGAKGLRGNYTIDERG